MVDTVVTAKPQFVGTSPEDSNLCFGEPVLHSPLLLTSLCWKNQLTFSVGLPTGWFH